MTARAAKKRKPLTVSLRERAPLADPGRPARVDHDKGVIYGVKVVGRVSPNTHGVAGAEGTEYTLEALADALPLYEGIKCNVDHPPRAKPGMERSARDRFAWLENVTVQEAGIFGDLHFLDPTDPLSVKMMRAAELKPDAYALSHNAVGKGEVRNRRYVVTQIPEVHSVDIVADGGTNRSLFEGRTVKQVKVCEVLRNKVLPALKKGRARRLLRLLESDKMDDGNSPVMEEDDSADHRDKMYHAMRACEEAGDDESAEKIHKLLGPPKKEEDLEEDEGDEPRDEGNTDSDEGESQAGRGKPEKPKGEYNDAGDKKGKESMESRQRRVRRLAKLAGVEATTDLVESLAHLGTDGIAASLEAIKKASGGQSGGKSSAPRSAAAGSVRVQESRGGGQGVQGDGLRDWCQSLMG